MGSLHILPFPTTKGRLMHSLKGSRWRPWKNGKSVLAAIPTKPDQIWKYSTRINLKAFTTRKKDTDVLHTPPLPTPKWGLMDVIEWESCRTFWELHLTSKYCFHLLSRAFCLKLGRHIADSLENI